MLTIKRAYDPAAKNDGTRFLVERLWPRGIKKVDLPLDAWLPDVGPSTALRKWFSHDPAKWDAFRTRYFRELDARPETWEPIAAAARRGPVTLVFSSRDSVHNNAVALQEYLAGRVTPASRSPRRHRR
jgi:uncharacterized protein YeaO (DUF488 family)